MKNYYFWVTILRQDRNHIKEHGMGTGETKEDALRDFIEKNDKLTVEMVEMAGDPKHEPWLLELDGYDPVCFAEIECLTPAELLKKEVVRTDHSPYLVHNLIHNLPYDMSWHNLEDKEWFKEAFRIDLFGDVCYDGERSWTLGAVYYKGVPVFIFQKGGRGGRDHSERFLLNRVKEEEMVAYLMSVGESDEPKERLYGMHEEIPFLTIFYGNSLAEIKDNK